jgi:hypothetical protein
VLHSFTGKLTEPIKENESMKSEPISKQSKDEHNEDHLEECVDQHVTAMRKDLIMRGFDLKGGIPFHRSHVDSHKK